MAEPLRLAAVIGLPAATALLASWLLDPASALVLGVFVGAVLGIAVKPHTVVLLLASRGAVREERWVPAQLTMRGAITSAGLGCFGVGAALLAGGPGMVSVVVSSVAFGLGVIIISSAPDRLVHFDTDDAKGPESPKRWVRTLDAAYRSDGWAGFGAGVLAQPIAWVFSGGNVLIAVTVTVAAVALGAFASPVSKLVRSIWRLALKIVPKLVEQVPNSQWIRPGSIFWTWVDYDSPDEAGTSGKDRPVLCISTAGGTYYAVALTSKDHTYRGDVIEMGTGPWDRQQRTSFVRLRPILNFTRGDVRRYDCQLDDRRFQMVLSIAREVNGALPGDQTGQGDVGGRRVEWISPSARIVVGHGIAIWFVLLFFGIAVRSL